MWTGNQESTKSRHAPCFSLTRQVSMYVCFFTVVDFMVGYPSPFINFSFTHGATAGYERFLLDLPVSSMPDLSL